MSQAGEINSGNSVLPATVPTTFSTNGANATPVANELEILGAPGTTTTGAGNTITINSFIPNAVVTMADDFIGSGGVAALSSAFKYSSSGINNTVAIATHPGIIANNSLSAVQASWVFLSTSNNGAGPGESIILGAGAITLNWVMNVAILSNGTNRYVFRFGFGDTNSTTLDEANGVYFEYSDNINGGDWNLKTANAGTRTALASTTPVDTAWHNFQISINAAGTSAQFFIDGVSQGTISTNLPLNPITVFFLVQAAVGTLAVTSIQADLWYLVINLTTPR